MTIETATYINQLDATYPASGDAKSEGDNHLRLIKSTIKATFPNLTATPVTPTSAELNYVAGVTGAIQTQLTALVAVDATKAPLASPALTGTPTAPTATLGTSTTQLATTAFVQAAGFAATFTGTLAQLNANVTDADVASLAGIETLTNKTLTGYTETVYTLAGTDIAVANGTVQTKTLAANTTFTESLADGQSVMLGITAGAFSVTWPTTVWAKVGGSGVAPTLTSTGVNWVILWQTGGTLRGSFLGTT